MDDLCKDLYLASPGFNDHENRIVDALVKIFEENGLSVYSPFRDSGRADGGNNKEIFIQDVMGILKSQVLVANITGDDAGTIWEIVIL